MILLLLMISSALQGRNPALQTPNGIYEEGGRLDNLHLSWGHDEYLYLVTKDYPPQETLWMIRYHSCYPIRRGGCDGLAALLEHNRR
jgi:hypothetical protein